MQSLDTPMERALIFLRRVALWMIVALPLVLPFRKHGTSLLQLLIYAPAGILLLSAFMEWIRTETPGDPSATTPVSRKFPLVRLPFPASLALVCATALLSIFYSLSRSSSLDDFRDQLLCFILIFFAVINLLRDRAGRKYACWSLFLAGVVAAVYGIFTFYTGQLVEASRAMGSMASYTRSAMYFILWIPLISAMLLYGPPMKWPLRALLVLGIVLASWLVVLTGTRGAWIVIFLSALILIGIRIKRRRWAALVLVLCLLPALAVPAFWERCMVTVHNLSDPNALLSERLPLWENAAGAIADHPWVGIGYGSEIFQQDAVRAVYPMRNYKYQPHAHNFYLEAAAESGLLHLVGLLSLFLGFLMQAGKALRRHRRAWNGIDRAIVIGAFTGLAAMLPYGMVGHFHESRVAMMLWYLIALACAVTAQTDAPATPRTPAPDTPATPPA